MRRLSRLRLRLWPHRYANIPQPWWYDLTRYWRARLQARAVPVSHFPDGGAFVCPFCDRTFPDHYARNVHEWRDHVGCPRYRIDDFHEWIFSGRSALHSFRCRPEECEHGCHGSGDPFRRV